MNQIFLIGFMGTGKSTVARYLKEQYGYTVVEMDQCIEEEEGMCISHIFEAYGESYFREKETEVLRKMELQPFTVVSCGGGVVLREENVALMKEKGRIILLTASPETIYKRVSRNNNRPLLCGKHIDDIRQMMEKRREYYEKAADVILSVDGKPSRKVGDEIMSLLNEEKKRIVLASASPRRREILEQAGYTFDICVSDQEEVYRSTTPSEIVKELALMKARDVSTKLDRRNLVVIGADTVVANGNHILGKPGNDEEAFEMIHSLQGNAHQVFTGVAILSYDENGVECLKNEAVCTTVYVDSMEDEEIYAYLGTGEHRDKAGSYAIQGKFAPYIEKIEGDYYNVVGLPISYIRKALKEVI